MTSVNQAEFAALMGWSAAYVTKLKKADRLVMTADSRVDVEASQARILATRDPNRDDVVSRNVADRAEAKVKPPPADADVDEDGLVDFQTARALKENYLARQAKVDYEERIEKLVDAEAVSMKQYELARQIRDSLLAIPSRIAEQVAAESDSSACARLLEQEIRQALEAAAKLAGEMDGEASAPVPEEAGE
jgi:tRNA U34 5-carboxymethylaminomethyl modifying GTPase MnmE/TrmE